MTVIELRPFTVVDQAPVRALIWAGMTARFGFLDESANPDVDDIRAHFIMPGETFLVAWQDDQISGCGALMREHGSDLTARIVRVSVSADRQRQGVGRLISTRLLEIARERGFSEVLVETNEGWTSALSLYQALGFREYTRIPNEEFGFVEVHMRLSLCVP